MHTYYFRLTFGSVDARQIPAAILSGQLYSAQTRKSNGPRARGQVEVLLVANPWDCSSSHDITRVAKPIR